MYVLQYCGLKYEVVHWAYLRIWQPWINCYEHSEMHKICACHIKLIYWLTSLTSSGISSSSSFLTTFSSVMMEDSRRRSWCWFSRSRHCDIYPWTVSMNIDTMSDMFRSKSLIASWWDHRKIALTFMFWKGSKYPTPTFTFWLDTKLLDIHITGNVLMRSQISYYIHLHVLTRQHKSTFMFK